METHETERKRMNFRAEFKFEFNSFQWFFGIGPVQRIQSVSIFLSTFTNDKFRRFDKRVNFGPVFFRNFVTNLGKKLIVSGKRIVYRKRFQIIVDYSANQIVCNIIR